jgi:hypothetical protein
VHHFGVGIGYVPDGIMKGSVMDRVGSGKDRLWTGLDPERIGYGPDRSRKWSAMGRLGAGKDVYSAEMVSVSVFRVREKVFLSFSFIKRKYFPYLRKYFRDRKYFLN